MSDRGAFLSFLDYLDQMAQVPENLLRGNVGAAGRHLADLALKPIDAVLPGDWIPDIAQKEDYTSPSELLDIDKEEHPYLGFGADLVGGTLLNPSTYLGGAMLKGAGALAKGVGGLAAKVISKVPQGAAALKKGGELAEEGGRLVRRTFGAERFTANPEAVDTQGIVQKATNAKLTETTAGAEALKASAMSALSPEERSIVSDVMQNVLTKDGKPVGAVSDAATALDRLAAHPGVTPEKVDRLKAAIGDAGEIGRNQKAYKGIFTPEDQTNLTDDYLMRKYSGQSEEQQIHQILGNGPEGMGGSTSTKGIKLETPEEIAGHLDRNPGVTFERDAAKLMASRAEQQGTLAQRAEVGKALVGDSFAMSDPEMKAMAQATIENMARTHPEGAKALSDLFNGVAQRGKVMSILAKGNEQFKKFAVYGALIPKLGSISRNAISGVWQAFANPESRATAVNAFKNLDSTLVGSITDAMGFKYPRDQLKGVIDDIQSAFSGSKGASSNAVQALRAAGKEDAAKVIESGVLDGFVRTDDIAKEMARTPWRQKLGAAWNWPAKIFKGVEDRMRIGMFLDLSKTHSAADAARITGDSLYRYGSTSLENRTARDIIPFFQFQAKAIPQSAKLLAEKPALAAGMASALHEDPDQPIYPYMEGKLNIPLGRGEQGDQQYLTGLGLPFEALGSIPNPSASAGDFGRELRQNIVGNAQPLLKAAAALTMGKDPYFETPYGSYDKMPVFGSAGGAGRYYNMAAQTGLIQPLDSILRSVNSITDPRETPGVKALDVLTGAKIANVDEDVALRQQLEQTLTANPQVRQYRTFYQGGDPDQATEDVIQQYHDAKARIKAKRGLSFP